jgi:hypothetical protein
MAKSASFTCDPPSQKGPDLNAGGRFLDRDQFVNAIAPKGDLTRIGRAQYAVLFRVADVAKRGLLSWDDFVVFQTLLKRPDADYYIAFQYFDVYVHARLLSLAVQLTHVL